MVVAHTLTMFMCSFCPSLSTVEAECQLHEYNNHSEAVNKQLLVLEKGGEPTETSLCDHDEFVVMEHFSQINTTETATDTVTQTKLEERNNTTETTSMIVESEGDIAEIHPKDEKEDQEVDGLPMAEDVSPPTPSSEPTETAADVQPTTEGNPISLLLTKFTVDDARLRLRKALLSRNDRVQLKQQKSRRYKCDHCEYTSINDWHRRRHEQRRHSIEFTKFTCSTCNRAMSSEERYKTHMQYSHAILPIGGVSTTVDQYHCAFCPSTFPTAYKTKRHEDCVHLNVRQFVCPKCAKRYKQNVDLLRHLC